MTSAPEPDLPRSLEELTPEWLTATLRGAGVLGGARIVEARRELVGEGEGFMGGLARIHLSFDRPEPAAPTTLVAKLPTTIREVRELGELLGLYEREVRFYSELAPSVPVRTPRCYFAGMDPNPGARYEEAALRLVERAPGWLLPLLGALGRLGARHSRRRYVLLLEDLAPLGTADQLAGCGATEAEGALDTLARLHAAFWEKPRQHPWLRPIDTAARLLHRSYRLAQRRQVRAGRLDVSPELVDLSAWLVRHGVDLLHQLAGPPATLLHADYRLDNLALSGTGGEDVVIDWQIPVLGLGVYDVAYFLCGSLREEVGSDEEEALVVHWLEQLRHLGVRDYGVDRCLDDYRRARLFMLYRVIAGVEAVDQAHERGRELMRMWLRRLALRLRGTRPDELRSGRTPPRAGSRPPAAPPSSAARASAPARDPESAG